MGNGNSDVQLKELYIILSSDDCIIRDISSPYITFADLDENDDHINPSELGPRLGFLKCALYYFLNL